MRSLSLPPWTYKLGSLDPSAACEQTLFWYEIEASTKPMPELGTFFFSVQGSRQRTQGFQLDRPFESWGDLISAENAEPAVAEAPASWFVTVWF